MRQSILLFLALVACRGILLAQPSPTPSPGVAARDRTVRPAQDEMQEARRRLHELGYWLAPDAVGADASLRHALIAFQKIEGRPATGKLTAEELDAIRQARPPQPLDPGAPHIEVDLQRQVLFFLQEGAPLPRVLPISSGTGELFTEGGVTRRAITPIGRFKIHRKIKGWRKSPLGLLYYPNYIFGGIAIHGNPSVPATPASHGCIRIPMFASREFSALTEIGLPVLVHEGTPPPQ